MKTPIYNKRPIGSIQSLAKLLSCRLDDLLALANEADKYYCPNKPEIKPNGGGIRQTYRVLPKLKIIQKRIIEKIFRNIVFPDYLQGGIRDTSNPRDYIKNAGMHVNKAVIIKEDIANFFPSIKDTYVLKIWKYFFHFSDQVSQILTKLTTFDGFVPQGASTSSYIANLIFWDIEPQLEEALTEKGFTYSRLVDDITVSSSKQISRKDRFFIVSSIYKMLFKKGVKPKRKKHSIQPSSHRMTIHRLNVNSLTPTINSRERQKIWVKVKECESMVLLNPDSSEYNHLFNKIQGKVAILARLHPSKGKKYINRLLVIKPRKHSQV